MSVITYEREYREEFQDHTSALERLAKVEQERDTLLAALKAVEWVDYIKYGDHKCPWCEAIQNLRGSHFEDCPRQAAITAVGGE